MRADNSYEKKNSILTQKGESSEKSKSKVCLKLVHFLEAKLKVVIVEAKEVKLSSTPNNKK